MTDSHGDHRDGEPDDDRSEAARPDPDAPGSFVDDGSSDEVPEPNEPA